MVAIQGEPKPRRRALAVWLTVAWMQARYSVAVAFVRALLTNATKPELIQARALRALSRRLR
jgi:hypothetical protein